MTPAQNTLYWREWRLCAEALKKHGRAVDSAARHALHLKALGYNKSSKAFYNSEFDKVLAVFRAWSAPSDLNAQLRQIEETPRRIRIAQAQAINLSWAIWPRNPDGSHFEAENKLNAMAKRICRHEFEACDEAQLQRLIGVLKTKLPAAPEPVSAPEAYEPGETPF